MMSQDEEQRSFANRKVIAEYIWIGGSGGDLRSKARTLPGPVSDPSCLPKWIYDGFSTGQAPIDDSDVILYPHATFRDPFRGSENILVICSAYTPAEEPIPTNKRHAAAKIFNHPDVVAEDPWYGIEQEYTLLQKDVTWALGWPVGGFPGPQGPYYCGAGADKAFGRDIVDAHYKACMYAGVNIGDINGEVISNHYRFQVSQCGISVGDHLYAARYILERTAEMYGVLVSFEPNAIPGSLKETTQTSALITRFSAKSMRKVGGYEDSQIKLEKLWMRHKDDMAAKGEGNETNQKLKTLLQVFPDHVVSIGAGGAKKVLKGYILEDRTAASNIDPYEVTSKIAEIAIIWKPGFFKTLVTKVAMLPFVGWVKKLFGRIFH